MVLSCLQQLIKQEPRRSCAGEKYQATLSFHQIHFLVRKEVSFFLPTGNRTDNQCGFFALNQIDMSQKSFAVQDINHAALLLSRGYKMSHISREGPIVYWHFPYEVDLITREIQDFINGEARGNFKDFAEALRTLKQTIRQAY